MNKTKSWIALTMVIGLLMISGCTAALVGGAAVGAGEIAASGYLPGH